MMRGPSRIILNAFALLMSLQNVHSNPSFSGPKMTACNNFIVNSVPGGKDTVNEAAKHHVKWMTSGRQKSSSTSTHDYEFEKVMNNQRLAQCTDLTQFGKDYDEMKYFCSPPEKRSDCNVFSIGSNNTWQFEEQMFRDTNCTIHTFDCTVDGVIPPAIQSRTKFYKKCWGKSHTAPADYLTYQEMVHMSGAKEVSYLKIDIEGYEWHVLNEMVMEVHFGKAPEKDLPLQMFIELHLDKDANGVLSVGEKLIRFFEHLFSVGYMIMFDRPALQIENHDVLLTKVMCRDFGA
jgi:hypothetical protein